ncbi:MAG: hypothetical protein JWO05_2385 [Gemmatimonadetes bacterium]|nr:hypothetical protein [Gemmatimonadota bacterium]
MSAGARTNIRARLVSHPHACYRSRHDERRRPTIVPLIYWIRPAPSRIVDVECVGQFTLAEISDTAARLAADPALPPRPIILFDASQTNTALHASELPRVLAALADLRERGLRKIAIVAPAGYLFALARAFQTLTLPVLTVDICTDRESADAWVLEKEAAS